VFSHVKNHNFGSNLTVDGVNQNAYLPSFKLKSLDVFNISKTLSCRLDEFQAYTNPIFQPFCEEDDNYGSNNSSLASPRDSFFAQVELESSNAIIILVLVIEATNLEEQLADIKVTLDRLPKESVENDAQIKSQNK